MTQPLYQYGSLSQEVIPADRGPVRTRAVWIADERSQLGRHRTTVSSGEQTTILLEESESMVTMTEDGMRRLEGVRCLIGLQVQPDGAETPLFARDADYQIFDKDRQSQRLKEIARVSITFGMENPGAIFNELDKSAVGTRQEHLSELFRSILIRDFDKPAMPNTLVTRTKDAPGAIGLFSDPSALKVFAAQLEAPETLLNVNNGYWQPLAAIVFSAVGFDILDGRILYDGVLPEYPQRFTCLEVSTARPLGGPVAAGSPAVFYVQDRIINAIDTLVAASEAAQLAETGEAAIETAVGDAVEATIITSSIIPVMTPELISQMDAERHAAPEAVLAIEDPIADTPLDETLVTAENEEPDLLAAATTEVATQTLPATARSQQIPIIRPLSGFDSLELKPKTSNVSAPQSYYRK